MVGPSLSGLGEGKLGLGRTTEIKASELVEWDVGSGRGEVGRGRKRREPSGGGGEVGRGGPRREPSGD